MKIKWLLEVDFEPIAQDNNINDNIKVTKPMLDEIIKNMGDTIECSIDMFTDDGFKSKLRDNLILAAEGGKTKLKIVGIE